MVPRDGSFALALLGRARKLRNSLALKLIVDLDNGFYFPVLSAARVLGPTYPADSMPCAV